MSDADPSWKYIQYARILENGTNRVRRKSPVLFDLATARSVSFKTSRKESIHSAYVNTRHYSSWRGSQARGFSKDSPTVSKTDPTRKELQQRDKRI